MKNLKKLFKLSLYLVLIFIIQVFTLTSLVAQSTDINNPTPLTATEINGTGDGLRHQYYYVFNAGPGTLQIHVQANARYYSTGVAVDLLSPTGESVLRMAAITTPGTPDTQNREYTISGNERIVMQITVDENNLNYRVWLEGPINGSGQTTTNPPPTDSDYRNVDNNNNNNSQTIVAGNTWETAEPWTSYGINSVGAGNAYDMYYVVNAGGGTLTLNAEAIGDGTHSTCVTAELFSIDHRSLLCVTSAAPQNMNSLNRASMTIDNAQRYILKISVRENSGAYSVWIDGPVIR